MMNVWQNLILGGTETTMVTLTLTWVLSLLPNNHHELKKLLHAGKDRQVNESDIRIVKETLRLYPPTPLISFHSAMEDCMLSAGYHTPGKFRGTSVWNDPEKFQPEKFLTSHKGTDVRVPFGSGRRSCPGISLGLQMVHVTLASFLHSFEVAKPSNEDHVDMTQSPGLTNLKATPLQVLLKPRLSFKVYGN